MQEQSLSQINNSKKLAQVPRLGRVKRWALYGGLLSGNLIGLLVAFTATFLFAEEITAYYVIGGLLAGSVGAFVALRRARPGQRSLGKVERELQKGLAMLERGLINEEDYLVLKQRLLQGQGAASFDWRIPLWGAIIGTSFSVVIMSNLVGLVGALPGIILGGIAGASTGFLSKIIPSLGLNTPTPTLDEPRRQLK